MVGFVEVEQAKPGDGPLRLVQDMEEAAVDLQMGFQFRPEEREKIFILTRKKRRSLLPAQVRLFTERRFLIRLDTLMKNILHISKIWM